MIFRFDDVNPNTSFNQLREMTHVIECHFPEAEVWYAVNILARLNNTKSVYPNVPFKDKENSFFWNVDISFNPNSLNRKLISHGLIHCDHSRISKDAQEMSIVSSCRYLDTKIFAPPFNRFNNETKEVCFENGIEIIDPSEWLSAEHNAFNKAHKKWYLHPWKWNALTLDDYLSVKP